MRVGRSTVHDAVAAALVLSFVGAPAAAQEGSPSAPPVVCLGPTEEPAVVLAQAAGGPPAESPAADVTTITSNDGKLTLEIPEGAAPPDAVITATWQDASCAPPELAAEGATPAAFYAMRPSGLVFSAPVRVTIQTSLEELGVDPAAGSVPLVPLADRSADGAWEWLDELEVTIDLDTGGVELAGSLGHFSDVIVFTAMLDASVQVTAPIERQVPVGKSYTKLIALTPGSTDATIGSLTPRSADETVAVPSASTLDGLGGSATFECSGLGAAVIGAEIAITGLGSPPLVGPLGLEPVTIDVYVGLTLSCTGHLEAVCFVVVHKQLKKPQWPSYFRIRIKGAAGVTATKVRLTISGVNDGEPFTASTMERITKAGINGPGAKAITMAELLEPGGPVDVLNEVRRLVGRSSMLVRYPKVDSYPTACTAP